ncbi:Pyrimidine/purine nucleoside phosphorylase [Sinobacterium norvegicum]|uniref:Pyrimidine/purine nucleoside phosphorylase n=1 Tax=Sinobacterium norvegicum TaxID=1641715 RepID=A0ABM9AEQ9_9GAMM|nr:pyrimidine/purine nucleoside phosphorylase [Sinobacterium norvegicum]CAH0991681.1 Pyrimidine/purine nucleoside phosphorylase [Sinobacterium norvegicum]
MFKTNEYFDGNVKSIAFNTETLAATIGVMAVGDYEFGTSQREYMTVTSGQLNVILPGQITAKTFNEGETFIVEANLSFKVSAVVETSYLCKYED